MTAEKSFEKSVEKHQFTCGSIQTFFLTGNPNPFAES